MPGEFRYAISAGCAAALAVLAVTPESVWSALPTICVFRNMLGIECFGCGMTRALAAAMHGNFAQAMQYNPGSVVALPAVVTGALQGLLVTP